MILERSMSKAATPWPLVVAVALLVTAGLVNLYSSTRGNQPQAFYQQLIWLGVSLVLWVPGLLVDYRVLDKLSRLVWLVVVALLVAVLFTRPISGAHRWIILGPLHVQPSELVKLALILVLAHHYQNMERPGPYGMKDLVKPLAYTSVPAVLVLLEPDLGTSLIILFIGLTMILLAGVKRKTLAVLALAGLVAIPMAWNYGLRDYQKTRILTLLGGGDKTGAGYHSYQSLIAVGSGELWGKGYLEGTQNQMRFLPEQHTDFAFAVWAEEFGFVGSFLLLAVYGLILWLGLLVAWLAREKFGLFLAGGVMALLFFHVAVNIGMVIGLLPVVGMTLPLFSYGGSSLLVFMLGIALVVNVHQRRQMF